MYFSSLFSLSSETLSALSSEQANASTMPHFNTAESGYPSSYHSTQMSIMHSYPAISVGVGTGLNSSPMLQPPTISSKTASKRSPKLWPKRNANAVPANASPPLMREWSGICLGTKEEFSKLHEEFGKEVKELIADWSKRGQGGVVVQEENLIDFG